MGLQFDLPWRSKPLPPPRPASDDDPRLREPRRGPSGTSGASDARPTRRPTPHDRDLDELLYRSFDSRSDSREPDPLGRVLSNKVWTTSRLDAIIREYDRRGDQFKPMTLSAWLFEHGVRINP